MEIVFYVFAILLIPLSFKSFVGGVKYLRFFRTELAKKPSACTPFVSIIAPCRGNEEGLEQNLSALFEQHYPAYEVIFVVDDPHDDAVPAITRVRTGSDAGPPDGHPGAGSDWTPSRPPSKLVIALKARSNSQKCENLREAVLHADDKTQIFVFVDSDTRPSPNWLHPLVSPVADETVGAATGYRWYISKTPTFASELRSVWNASIASALGPNTRSNFCWGGSTAIRREMFEELNIREKWKNVVSDDFAVTAAIKNAGLPIAFVPQALTASVENCTFAEMLEFTTRQMKLTRVYATKLWVMSLVGSTLFCGVMLAAVLIVIFRARNDFAVMAAFFTLSAVTFFSIGKSWLRLAAVKLALSAYRSELKRQAWTQNTLWLITPALFLYNSVAAWFSRRITWRGTTYELKSNDETVIISD